MVEQRDFNDDNFDDGPEATGNADWEEAGDINMAGFGGNDLLDDLDLTGFDDIPDMPADDQNSSTVTVGDSSQTKWLKKRKLPADLIAAGEFEEALTLLKKRLGLINVDPLETLFKQAY